MNREARAKMLAHTQEVRKLTGYSRPNGMALAGVNRSRDADVVDATNFDVALARLQAIDSHTDTVRFGHFAFGWIDEILAPLTAAIVDEVAKMVDALAEYPILDEDAYVAAESADLIETLTNCYSIPAERADEVASWLFENGGVTGSHNLRSDHVSEATAALGLDDDDDDDVMTYNIVRFYRDSDTPSEVIREGLTLEEAQAHCQDETTRDSDGAWFDGYRAAD